MKRAAIIIVILTVTTVGVLGYLYIKNVDSANKQNSDETTRMQEKPSQGKVTDSTTPGAYEDYTPEKLASTEGDRVLFFHASWCPQCRSIDSGITDGDVPDGTTLFKVDYDSNQELRQKYGVTLQTTFVRIDADGNLVEKYVAYTKPTFDEVKKNFLEK